MTEELNYIQGEPQIPAQCTESLSTMCLMCPQYHIIKVPRSKRTWAKCTGDFWYSNHMYNRTSDEMFGGK
jgi:hypothetical protein